MMIFMTGIGHFLLREDDAERTTIVDLVRSLERIKTNLPKYRGKYPEITRNMQGKQAELEDAFLGKLQALRIQEGVSQRYSMYHNWFKTYKGIDEL